MPVSWYAFLDDQINSRLGVDVGYNALLAMRPYQSSQRELQDAFTRYEHLKTFQQISLSLFKASLQGEFDPELAALVVNELPETHGLEFHRQLTERQHRPPVFFRTDEVATGKICEVQSPGSLWGMYELLFQLYGEHSATFGEPSVFPRCLAENLSSALKNYLGKEPVLHHLLDNSTNQVGMKYFIQRTRDCGLRYFSYDRGITQLDFNFLRTHTFSTLLSEIYVPRRLQDCEAGNLHYDLSPSILFDEKMSLTFPFWKKTRDYYPDEVRRLFPHTQLITPDGFEMEDGTHISIEEFCNRPQSQRKYYLKYAGSNPYLFTGSRGVHLASSYSRIKLKEFFGEIAEGYAKRRYWLIQKGCETSTTTDYLTREGEEVHQKTHVKFSNFYGPEGLMGIFIMYRPFHKVHGTSNTILSIIR